MIPTIIEDEREITYVSNHDGTAEWNVGRNGITSIRPYNENGDMAPIVWLAVYRGDEILARVRADYYVIGYAAE